jgi:hypothetical protein
MPKPIKKEGTLFGNPTYLSENFYSELLHDGTCLFYQLNSGILLNISAAAKNSMLLSISL